MQPLRGGGALWNKVYKRQVIGEKRFNENINLGEDGLFNLNLAENINKIAVINRKLYFYRKNVGSITHTSFRRSDLCQKEFSEYVKILKFADNDYCKTYCKGMIVCSGLKYAESIIVERKPWKALREIKKEFKRSIKKDVRVNSTTKKIYKVFIFSIPAFALLTRIKIKVKKTRLKDT